MWMTAFKHRRVKRVKEADNVNECVQQQGMSWGWLRGDSIHSRRQRFRLFSKRSTERKFSTSNALAQHNISNSDNRTHPTHSLKSRWVEKFSHQHSFRFYGERGWKLNPNFKFASLLTKVDDDVQFNLINNSQWILSIIYYLLQFYFFQVLMRPTFFFVEVKME